MSSSKRGKWNSFLKFQDISDSAVACVLFIIALRIFILDSVKFFKEHAGIYQLFFQVASHPFQFYNWTMLVVLLSFLPSHLMEVRLQTLKYMVVGDNVTARE